jgi:hypothetical protein
MARESDISAEDLMAGNSPDKANSKIDEATAVLTSYLANGPKPYHEIMELAKTERSAKELCCGKDCLGVISNKSRNEWYWSLPDE